MPKAHYDDPDYSYENYWTNRAYEHQSEIQAIQKLLSGKKYSRLADLGGGYGRLLHVWLKFSKNVFLLEPSRKLRRIAAQKFKNNRLVHIEFAQAGRIPLPDKYLDLIAMIRVIHHLPDPDPAFSEINRVLKPDGYLLLEFANSLNFKSRLKSIFFGTPISTSPVERRSLANIKKKTIPFVNHHPQHIFKLLSKNHFVVEKTLSVSNFRIPFIKNIIPIKYLLFLESNIQHLASWIYFGPSIMILARKEP